MKYSARIQPAQNDENGQYYKVSDAASELKVSSSSLRRFEQEGRIKSIRLDNNYRVYDIASVNALKISLENERLERLAKIEERRKAARINTSKNREIEKHIERAHKEKLNILSSSMIPNFSSIPTAKYRKALGTFALILLTVFSIDTGRSILKNNSLSKISNNIEEVAGKYHLAFDIFAKYDDNQSNKALIASAKNRSILGARDRVTDFVFNVNVPTFFRDEITVDGISNLLGGIITENADANLGTGALTTGTINMTGAAILNGLLAIDETTETTLEGTIDINGDVIGTGLNEVEVVALSGLDLNFSDTSDSSIVMIQGGTLTTVPQSEITELGTIGAGVWEGTEIGTSYGGTGLTSYIAGDLLYANTSSTLTTLPIGTSGYFLVSNGSAPTWNSASAFLNNISWATDGNTGLDDSLNFIGTTDAVDMVIRTNNVERARILSNGEIYLANNVGIGTTNPAHALHIGNGSDPAVYIAGSPESSYIEGNLEVRGTIYGSLIGSITTTGFNPNSIMYADATGTMTNSTTNLLFDEDTDILSIGGEIALQLGTEFTGTFTANDAVDLGDGNETIEMNGSSISFDDGNLTNPLLLTNSATSFLSGDTAIVEAINTAYNAATGGGSGLWTLASGVVYPTGTGNDVAYGGTTSAAPYFYDTSTELLTLTNTTAGNSFRVNDQTADATPFIIDANGNVGIGTTTPAFKLDVAGNTNVSALYISGTQVTSTAAEINLLDGRSGILLDTNNAATQLAAWDQNAADDLTTSTNFSGDVSGQYNNIQLGNSVVGSLEISNNSIQGEDLESTNLPVNTYILSYDNASGGFTWVANSGGTGASKWTESGAITYLTNTINNVGIGNTNPQFKLDVTGSLNMSSLYISGTQVTSTATELNILDGALVSTAELNLLDGRSGTLLDTINVATQLSAWDQNASNDLLTTDLGVTVQGYNANTSFLGQTIEGSEITDGTIEEADLEVTNVGTDNYILSYDSVSSGFTWVDPATVGTNYWVRSGTLITPAIPTDTIATLGSIGVGTTNPLYDLDVAGDANVTALYISGTQVTSTAAELNILDGVLADYTELNLLNGRSGTLLDTANVATQLSTWDQDTSNDLETADLGVTVQGYNANTSFLGQTIEGSEITDGTIEEADIEATNAGTDNYVLTYDSASGGFTWVDPATAGTNYWLRTGTTLSPLTSGDSIFTTGNIGIGASNPAFNLNVSGSTNTTSLFISGTQVTSTATELNLLVGRSGTLLDTANVATQLSAWDQNASNDLIIADLGVTVQGYNANTSLIGQTIEGSEITDGTIEEVDLEATNAGTNGYILSYDNATGGFTWIANDGGAGASKWTDGGAFTYLTQTTDDIYFGGATADTSAFFFDVSTGDISFEGSTADTFETLFDLTDPTADRTITIPNASGEISLLGQTVEGSEITDGTIEEADIEATNAGTDNYVLTYDSASGGFTWVDPATAGTNYWSRTGTTLSPITSGDSIFTSGNIGIGASNPAFNLNVSGSTNTTSLYIAGTQVTSTAAELNILDGVLADATELNILNGALVSTSELNLLNGRSGTLLDTANVATQLSAWDQNASNDLITTDLGVTVQGYNANTSFLGQTIEGSEITDGTIEEVDLEATNAGTDNYILSYDSASGGFTWIDPATAGTTYWSRSGTTLSPLTSGDSIFTTGNVGIGASNPAFNLNVSGSTNTISLFIAGTQVTSSAVELNILDGALISTTELNLLSGRSGTLLDTANVATQLSAWDQNASNDLITTDLGVTVQGYNANTSFLGQTIEGSEITDGTIEEADIESTNAGTDNYILSYDSASGGFTWVDPAAAGTNYWSRTGTTLSPLTSGDSIFTTGNIWVGASNPSFNLNISGSTNTTSFYISGTQVTSNATELNILDGALINTTELNLLSGRSGTLLDTVNVATQLSAWDQNASNDLITTDLGVTVQGYNANTSFLGQTIEGSEITDGTIEEADIESTNAGTDNYILSYDSASGGFTWIDPATTGTAYTADNGLTLNGSIMELGGTLNRNTTIAQGNFSTIFNLSGTGDFDIQDNGASVFFIKDDGNIGIGTTNPTYKLQLASGDLSIDSGNLRIGNGTPNQTIDGEDAYIEGGLEVDGNARFDGVATFSNDIQASLIGAEKVTFTGVNRGNDSIFNIILQPSASSGTVYGILMDQTNSASANGYDAFLGLSNSDTDLTIPDGILMTSAGGAITDALDLSDSDIVNALNIGANTILASDTFTIDLLNASANDYLRIENSNGTYSAGLTVEGNLGIGNTSPTYKLDVSGDANVTGTYRMAGTDYGQYFIDSAGSNGQVWTSDGSGRGGWSAASGLGGSGTDNYLTRWNGTSSVEASSVLYETDGGNIGLGTTDPTYKLTVAGIVAPSVDDTYSLGTGSYRWSDVYVGPASLHIGTNGNEAIIGYNITNNYISFDPDGDTTPEFVMDDDGYLGIGTTDPRFNLDVNGSVNTTSIYISGTQVTTTAAELNMLDGAVINYTELNLLNGRSGTLLDTANVATQLSAWDQNASNDLITTDVGVTVQGYNANTSFLGQTIEGSEITDGTIEEAELEATNAGTDNYILSYDSASGGFTWVDPATAGTTYWSRSGTTLSPLTSGDSIFTTGNVGIGASNPAFNLNVSGSTNTTSLYISGTQVTSTATELNLLSGRSGTLLDTANVATQLSAWDQDTSNDLETADLGVTVQGYNANTSLLGQTIEGSEITDGTIEEAELEATNAASDDYILSYDLASGGFTWIANSGGTGSSKWTDDGTFTYLTAATDDVAFGGTTAATAAFFFDVSTSDISFEGSTADDFETLLDVTDPTADRTITLPNASGEISLLGQTIEGSEIADNTIEEVDLESTNAATDGFILSYSNTTGGFTWIANTGGTGSSKWTDLGTLTHLTSTTDDVSLGGSTNTAPFYFNATGQLLTLTNTTAGNSFAVNDQAADTSPFIIDENGNVGVGTTDPSTKMQIIGNVRLGNTGETSTTQSITSGGTLIIKANDTGTDVSNADLWLDSGPGGGQGRISFATNDTEKMRLRNGLNIGTTYIGYSDFANSLLVEGNVGIGTSNPGSFNLNVNGSTNTTSLYISGTQVTSTAAELNILDGVLADYTEINILNGALLDTTELNLLNGRSGTLLDTANVATQLSTWDQDASNDLLTTDLGVTVQGYNANTSFLGQTIEGSEITDGTIEEADIESTNAGTDNYILSYDSASGGFTWVDPSTAGTTYWTRSGTLLKPLTDGDNIATTGRIGIGTTAPTNRLVVRNDSDSINMLTVGDVITAYRMTVYPTGITNAALTVRSTSGQTANIFNVQNDTGNSTYLTVAANGNVGIGTTNPGSFMLNVNGSTNTSSLYISGTQVTSTAAELNILDGVLADYTELNLLNGRSGTLLDTANVATQLSAWDQNASNDLITTDVGVTVQGYNANTSLLGQTIEGSEITDGTIEEADIESTNAGTDNYILSYDSASGGFTWVDPASAGTTYWARTGTTIAPLTPGDNIFTTGNIGIGASNPAFNLNVSGSTNTTSLYIAGTQVTSSAAELNILDGALLSTAELNLLNGRSGTLLDTANVATQLSAWDQNASNDLITTDLGVTVQGYNANTSLLGQTIEGSEITDGTIEEADIESTNAGTDNYILSYDSASGGFTWIDPATAGTTYWTRTGTLLKPLTNGDNIATTGKIGIGTSSPTAKLHIIGGANEKQLVVRANGTQTDNLQEWQDSSGTRNASIDELGHISIGNVEASAPIEVLGDYTAQANLPGFRFQGVGGDSKFYFQNYVEGLAYLSVNYYRNHSDSLWYQDNAAYGTTSILMGNNEVDTVWDNGSAARVQILANDPTLTAKSKKLEVSDNFIRIKNDKGVADSLLIIQGAVSQTGNLTEWRNSANTILSSVDEAGNFGIGKTNPLYNLDVNGSTNTTSLYISGTQVTSTAAELNILDGVLADYTELNLLNGRSGTLLDTANVATQLSAWDQNASNDLITTDLGVTVQGYNANTSLLGQTIEGSEITDGTIEEADLEATNAGTDNYILSYDSASGGFTWIDPATAGTTYWTRSGTLLKPLTNGDNIATTGRLGAGTTNPSYALDVVGGNTNTTVAHFTGIDTSARVMIDHASNTGFGLSIGDNLKWSNAVYQGNVTGNYDYTIYNEQTGINTLFMDGSTDYIGIGTSTPGYNLHVNGSINTTSFYISGTQVTSTAAELNILDGVLSDYTELNLLNGRSGTLLDTANVATQLSSWDQDSSNDLETADLGVTVQGYNANTSFLGQTIEGSEITDGTIEEADIESTNAGTDNYILSYDSASGGFTWIDPSTAGVSYWTRTGTLVKPSTNGDNIATTGSVGVGTTNPTEKLTIAGGNILLDNNQSINWKDSTGTGRRSAIISGINDYQFGHVDAGWGGRTYLKGGTDVWIETNGASGAFTDALVVKASGNVGIGTTAPGNKLDVISTTASEVAKFSSTAGSTRVIIDNAANPGFGLSVGSSVKWSNATYQEAGTGSNYDYIFWNEQTGRSALLMDGNTDNIAIGYTVPGTAKLAINGNVGIGTTSPGYNLHVNGSTNTTSFYISGTQVTSTAAELNILDGVLADYTELNLLNGRSGILLDTANVATQLSAWDQNASNDLITTDLGVTVQGYSANTSLLGQTIEGSEITDGTIEEADLEVTNAGTDNYILSYDSASGGFTWIDPSTAGLTYWTRSGTLLKPVTNGDNVATTGRLGAGTTNPSYALDVVGGNTSTTVAHFTGIDTSARVMVDHATNSGFGLSIGSAIKWSNTTYQANGAGNYDYAVFNDQTGNNTLFMDGSSDFVGIGTSTPSYNLHVNGSTNTTSFYISGTQVTSTAAELNILDGVLADYTELNLLNGRSGTLLDTANVATQLSAWDQNASNDLITTDLGVTVQGYNANTSLIGQTIEGSEITDGTIEEADIEATNAGTDNYVLTYDATSGGFTWIDPASLDTTYSFSNGLTELAGAVSLGGSLTTNMRLYDASNEYLFIDTTLGTMGIGLTNPTYQLDVVGDIRASDNLGLMGGSPTDGYGVNVSVGNNQRGYFSNLTTTSAGVNSYGMYVQSDQGGASTNGTQYGLYLDLDDINATRYGIFEAGGATNYFSGNLGIGTTAPGFALQVAGDIDSSTGTYRMAGTDYGQYFINGAGSNGQVWTSDGAGRGIWSAATGLGGSGTDNYLTRWNGTSAVEASSVLYETDGGNIGLGTTNPTDTLDIVGAGTVGLSLTTAGTTGRLYNDGNLHLNGGGNLWLDGTSIYLNAGNTNKVAIGSSSAAAILDIKGAGTGTGLSFATKDSANNYTLAILDNGNLGIGTTNPTEKLTVNGGNILQKAYGNPTLEGTYDSGDPLDLYSDVYVSNNYAYVAGGTAGLVILDITTASSPTLVGSYTTATGVLGVQVVGKYAYLADQNDGLIILDVSDPTTPTLVDSYDTGVATRKVYVSGMYAFLADYTNGLTVLDITNPANIIIAGTYNSAGNTLGVYVSGRYAYIADDASGIHIIDMNSAGVPTYVNSYNTTGNAMNVYVAGRYAYVADGGAGMHILDVSDPAVPTFVNTYNTGGSAEDVFVSGNYAYIADGTSGDLVVVDISNKASLSLVGTFDPGEGTLRAVYVSGKNAYLAGDGSMAIADINGIESPAGFIGNLQANDITVTENLEVGNNIYARSGLNVGINGISSDGGINSVKDINTNGTFRMNSVDYGQYFINGAGTTGQVWTSDGTGRGTWGTGTTANNGLTLNGGTVELGGTLNRNTSIAQGNFNTTFNLTGTGDFEIQDNGSIAFIVTDSGNVGVGTTNPLFKIESYANTNSEATLMAVRNASAGSSAQSRIQLFNDSGTTSADGAAIFLTNNAWSAAYANAVGFWNYENGPLIMATNGTEKMRVQANGNVGIGVSTPGFTLQVGGDIDSSTGTYRMAGTDYGQYFINAAGSNGQVWTSDGAGRGGWAAAGLSGTGTDNYLTRWNGTSAVESSSILYETDGGNLGLGTTAPTYKLQLASGDLSIDAGNLRIGNGTPDQTLNGEDAYIEGGFEVDGTSRFDGETTFYDDMTTTFLSGENMDIGYYGGGTNNILNISNQPTNTSGTLYGLMMNQTSSPNFYGLDAFMYLNNGDSDLTIPNGIMMNTEGAAITNALNVSDSDIVNALNIGANTILASDTFSIDLLNAAADDYLRVENSDGTYSAGLTVEGNLGIGNTTPTYKLDVTGDANVTGTYRMAGTDYGQYFIDGAGSNGQVWTSDGTGKGYWSSSSGGLSGSGTDNYIMRWDGTGAAQDSILYATDTNLVGIGTTAPTSRLSIFGTDTTNGQLRVGYDESNYAKFVVNASGELTISDASGDIAKLSSAGTEFYSPTTFSSTGDVSIFYDILLTNQTASNILSSGPLSIIAGESFEDNDLTLKTYGAGDVVMDLSGTGSLQLLGTDTSLLFNTANAGDTDYWAGIIDNANGTSDDPFSIGTGTTIGSGSLFTMTSAGSIGLGTTAPTYRLQLASGDLSIDSGNLRIGDGTANQTLNGEDAYIEGGLEVDGSARFDGVATFGNDIQASLIGAEKVTFTGVNRGNDSIFNIVLQPSASSGTVYGLAMDQTNSASANGYDAFLGLSNSDTDLTIADGLLMTSAGGAITDALDLSDSDIVNALNIGANTILASDTFTIDLLNASANDYLRIENSNGTYSAGLTVEGYVGIGTTAPNSKLHVTETLNQNHSAIYSYATQSSTSVDYLSIGIEGLGSGATSNWGRSIGVWGHSDSTNSYRSMGVVGSLNTTLPTTTFGFSTALWGDGAGMGYAGIFTSGNIGLGTSAPDAKVQVTGGGLCVGSDANCNSDNNTEGVIYSSSTAMTVYDVAENYPTRDETLTYQEVVELDPENGIFVQRASNSYSSKLLGIVSEEPGVLLGGFNGNQFEEERQVAIALSGRVPVKIDPNSPAIRIGDLLTASSSVPGTAIKATQAGFTIGKAMTDWNPNTSQTTVMVFVTSTYADPNTSTDYLGMVNSLDQLGTSMLNLTNSVNANTLGISNLNSTMTSLLSRTAATELAIQDLDTQVSTTPTGDFAEYIEGDEITEPGDIIAYHDQLAGKAVQGQVLAGVHSTNGNFVAGEELANTEFPILLGLSGITEVKVNTSNGNIQNGDPITISTTPGIGSKATQAGSIVGRAMEDYSNENSEEVGMIKIQISVGWFDPDENLASATPMTIGLDGSLVAGDRTVERMGAYSNLSTGSLSSGLINTLKLKIEGVDIMDRIDEISDSLTSEIDDLRTQVEELRALSEAQNLTEAGTETTVEDPEGILAQIQAIYQQFTDMMATLSMTVENNTLVVNTDMNVLGTATLGDVTATGEFNVGQISIDSLTNGIEITGPTCVNDETGTVNLELCEAQTIFIQKGKTGNVDYFDGKIVMTPEGNVTVSGTLTAEKVSTGEVEVDETSGTIGTATIVAGDTSIIIETAKINENSKVFITATTSTKGQNLFVIDRTLEESFEVSIDTAITEDIIFDWFIVNTK